MIKKNYIFSGCLLFMLVSCTLPGIKVDVVSERTALENQVLGTYNSLDQEMLLAASVRAIDSKGQISEAPPKSQDYKDAVVAMQTLAFHEDDLTAFKTLGWVGENNQGFLTPFPMEKGDASGQLKEFADRYKKDEFKDVVAQINSARAVVMKRVIELNENFTQKDMSEVQQIFGKLNAENALTGHKIQTQEGTWVEKK